MKSLLKAVALAAVLAVPAVSFAQSQPENGPVTRAQVRNELKQLESVGWRPNVVSPYYPEDYRAAQARLAARSGYGPSTDGTSQSGSASSYSPPVIMK
ncbi:MULTISPECIES: DUF4148 domain-containing protein [Paraburkholderia]|uniref:Uncharacterized protein DUF4148 n=1 Tax=Paraburkholderia tropica TaxID=92647 RepID=A0A1A5X0P5_9BURK|nr:MULTISPECIES: DUF4148 domain-containing protein [Paraburkholderia]MBB2978974.1 cytochrome c556 [Paraburkholderia tropica]MBB2999195.1 cytochrome c556 [Paraburkholderia tropica]MBB6318905.1 cytochrome c556 [Paraburkholderia tropica]MDE1138924.1 DUF4148 domain-containing protein [Paraburkholderia tropica]OBR47042.1 hypothetical protein A6456_19420 [Paraburkholderia tropica]